MEVDYVVVGAGAAGCVLAERLSRDPRVQVLLVESGARARNPLLYVPKGFFFVMRDQRYAYHYPTGPMGQDDSEVWIRGKAVGGSTAINGMMYARGGADDYNALGEDNPGWGWDHMLKVFRAMEDHPLGPSEQHGAGGPLHISLAPQGDELVQVLRGTAASCGVPVVADVDCAEGEAIGPVASTIRAGVRASAATAFLGHVRRRRNLTVLPRAHAGHLVFDGTRCVGVRVRRRGQQHVHRARREVVLTAGAVETPLLLERSGIGCAEVLHRAGVPLRRESPHVGERVIEQRAVTLKLHLRHGLGHNTELNSQPKQLRQAMKYLLQRAGPMATGPYPLRAAIRTRPELERPDAEMLLTTLSTDATGLAVAERSGMTMTGYSLHPTTTSSVHLSGPDPTDLPAIEASFLETETDRRAAAALLRRERDFAATEPLASVVCGEEAPGRLVRTDEQAVDYALATGAGLYHAVGSCAMGPRDDDVVDHRLRVRGVAGLRVVDASIFPTPPSAALAAPVMAAAWRAADLLVEET